MKPSYYDGDLDPGPEIGAWIEDRKRAESLSVWERKIFRSHAAWIVAGLKLLH